MHKILKIHAREKKLIIKSLMHNQQFERFPKNDEKNIQELI